LRGRFLSGLAPQGPSVFGLAPDGRFEGSVSGGCVEGEIIAEAESILSDGKPKTLKFGVADDTAWKVGLSCGGTIRVYVEKVD